MSAPTLAEDVYTKLKSQIISLRIPPGASLTEGELAQQFSLSKTPVREALGRLQREGLVYVAARSGYRVSTITLKDTRDLFGLRVVLEGEAAALAASAPKNPTQVEALERLGHATFDPDDADSIRDYLTQNTAFHVLIAEIGGNLRLATMLEGVLTELERVIHLSLSFVPFETVQHMEHNHVELITAIMSNDADAARSVSIAVNRSFETMINQALLTSPILMNTNLGGETRGEESIARPPTNGRQDSTRRRRSRQTAKR